MESRTDFLKNDELHGHKMALPENVLKADTALRHRR